MTELVSPPIDSEAGHHCELHCIVAKETILTIAERETRI